MKRILQKLAYPKEGICEERDLYFRVDKGTEYDPETNVFTFVNNSVLNFNTYFNAFALNKWLKYTSVNEVFLHLDGKGKFLIIWNNGVANGTRRPTLTQQYMEIFDDVYDKKINVESGDVVFFTLYCLSDEGQLKGGYYYADVDKKAINDINVCMVVCTFKREPYITLNLNNIRDDIINNKESLLYDKLDVIVSDNAHTLPKDFGTKHIIINENPNTGGAGGFTRGMIEMLKVQDEKKYTHILLTDDDITLDTISIDRLANFLTLCQGRYKEAFVGGAMFRLDQRNVQNEMANCWKGRNVTAINYKYDMNNFDNAVKNERMVGINYFSWWFCCMPAHVIKENNLPLPIFIKRDDIEYGLRNGEGFITLNGINVWHEPFEQKRPAYLEYYYIRNQLIMECTLYQSMTSKALIKKINKYFKDTITKFKYLEYEFFLRGINDFCKGIDWLKTTNAVDLNLDLLKHDRKFLPLEELPIPFDEDQYNASFIYQETKLHFLLRFFTMNGWFLPSKKEPAIVQSAFPIKLPFFRRRQVLNVEYITKRGYISTKSWSDFFKLLKLRRETIKTVKNYFNGASTQYSERWKELTNIDFWNEYLFDPNFGSAPSTSLPPVIKEVKEKSAEEREKVYVDALAKPVDKHLVYLESRKGSDFASNIFAVAKELNKSQYAKYKVYVGVNKDYLPTFKSKCRKNKLNRIKYVIKESDKFQRILATAKYFFTDFHLAPRFAKRDDQVVVSLWHGTPLKTLGKECKGETQISVQRIFNIADYQVYPGEFMRDKMIDVYWQQNLYNGYILCSGYPRNALFFDENRRKKIRNELGLNGKVAIMYMPTFRGVAGSNKNRDQNRNLIEYFKEIDKLLNDNQIFYLKLHNYNVESIDVNEFKHIKLAPSEYDNYELQNACDIMVTDYSSVFFDFAVSRRKIILFQYDQEEYLSSRGVCIPLNELPFPIVQDVKGLVEEINKGIEYDDTAFMKKYCTYDNKDATKILCEHVVLGKKLPEGILEYKLEKNGKQNIYIYSGSLRSEYSAKDFWDMMNKINYDKENFYILYYDPIMWKNAYRLAPLNDKCNQIGMWSYFSYTPVERDANQKFLKDCFYWDEGEKVLSKLYEREIRKHYGPLNEPDVLVLWNTVDVNVWRLYAHYGKKRIIVLHKDVVIGNPILLKEQENYEIMTIEEFNEYVKEHYN